MSNPGHAEIAQTALVVEAWRQDVLGWMRDFGIASKACVASQDIRTMLERLVETVAAIDAAAERIKELKDKAREYTRDTMESVGAFSVKADGVQAVLADAVRYPVVSDPSKVPAEYWVTADPKIDTSLLGKNMRAGAVVPGCTLNNGGRPVLKISRSANKTQEIAA